MGDKIPKGYKKTEIGIIPEDWEVKNLINAIGNKSSNIVAGPFGSNLKVEDYVNKGIPIIRLQNIEEHKFIEKDIKYISNDKARKLNYHSFWSGDLILAKLGDPLGKTCMIPNKIKYGIVVADVVRIRIDSPYADAIFIMYLLNHSICRKQLNDDITGSTRPRVNLNKVRSLLIPLPPLLEQRAIAQVLSDVDALIEKLDRLIEKKKLLKKGVMQQLLTGKKRLPGFKGEWVKKKLADVCVSSKYSIVDGPFGSQMKIDEFTKNGVPIIEMEHLGNGLFVNNVKRYISKEKFKQLRRSAVYPYDIVISKTGSLGYLAIVPQKIKEAIITSRLAKITLDKDKADVFFTYYWLDFLKGRNYWEKVSQGGTMQILSISHIKNVPFLDISIHEQQAIAQILSDMDAEIEALEKKKTKYEMIKKAMMNLLLTGKIRIKDTIKEELI